MPKTTELPSGYCDGCYEHSDSLREVAVDYPNGEGVMWLCPDCK